MDTLQLECTDNPQDKLEMFVMDDDPLEAQMDVSNYVDGAEEINSVTLQRDELEQLREWLDEVL